MSAKYTTEQEAFWAGAFGDAYIDRNNGQELVARQTAAFSTILNRTRGITKVLELGANIGINLLALKHLLPGGSFTAVEINQKAVHQLNLIEHTTVKHGSIFDFSSEELGFHDLAFTSGVLIHIHPEMLSAVYERLYGCSKKYILINEYYNPVPAEVTYRGHAQRLFKRDFAGEMLETYADLELIDYGFQYHRDPNFPADDSTWFLMQKAGT